MPDRLIEDNGILFAPRFGLTYDLTGNQSFIFRAGGGMFYDRYEGNIAFDADRRTRRRRSRRASPAAGCRTSIRTTRCWRRPALNAMQLSARCRPPTTSTSGFQKKLPGGVIWDIAYVGSIAEPPAAAASTSTRCRTARAFLPQNQDTDAGAEQRCRGRTRCAPDFLRPYHGLRQHQPAAVRRQRELPRAADADRPPLRERPVPERQLHVQQGARHAGRQRRLLAHRRVRQAGQLRAGRLRPPPHLQLQLGLPAAEERGRERVRVRASSTTGRSRAATASRAACPTA